MRFKILINTPSSKPENFIKMFDDFKDRIELHILTQTTLVKWYVAQPAVAKIYDIMADYKANKSSEAVHAFAIPEDLPLYEYVEFDRFLFRKPYEEIMTVARHHCQYVHNLLQAESYDCVIGEIGGFIHSLLYWYGQRLGVPFVWPMMSLWPDRFFLTSGGPTALQEQIAQAVHNPDGAARMDTHRDMARAYVDDFTSSTPVMSHVVDHIAANNQRLRRMLTFAVTAPRKIYTLLRGLAVKPSGYLEPSITTHIKNQYINRIYNAFRGHHDFVHKVPSGEKYALYYLHYEPDLSTLVWSPYFKNQLEVITNIAFSLPNGYRLYIKEHPLSVGTRPPGYYKKIRSIPQVRLIAPSYPSRPLLMDAQLVIAITGTVGWEALLFNKPVITLGNVFYNAFKGVRNVTDWTVLRSVIFDLLSTGGGFTKEDVVDFVVGVMRECVAGDYYQTITNPENLANNRQVAEGILDKIRSIKGAQ